MKTLTNKNVDASYGQGKIHRGIATNHPVETCARDEKVSQLTNRLKQLTFGQKPVTEK